MVKLRKRICLALVFLTGCLVVAGCSNDTDDRSANFDYIEATIADDYLSMYFVPLKDVTCVGDVEEARDRFTCEGSADGKNKDIEGEITDVEFAPEFVTFDWDVFEDPLSGSDS